jgi:hypothetical protein
MADSAVVPVFPARFQDTSTDCAICLSLLVDEEVVELTCGGHRWHFDCLKEQLGHAQPNHHAKRLLLSGCQCAKCGYFRCDHPALEHLTRKTDELVRAQ